jgi:hypothetical protein
MTERSGHWDGASIGDADTYTENAADGIGYRFSNADYESFWHDIMCRALFNGTGNRGVLYNWLNELAVTGVATPVAVDTGAALIYGLFYRNTSSLNVAVATPTNDTRYDRVVVRRDWNAQTARVTLIQGTEGGGIPAMTQSPAPEGSGVYDIPLATLEVTVGGVITVTDAREFVTFTTVFTTNSIATADIANDAVEWEQREMVGKTLRFGGRELLPLVSRFSYQGWGTYYLDGSVAATWGAAAATMEGWQVTGSGTANDMLFHVAFKVPADRVPGTSIQPILYWIDDFNGACNYDIHSAYQVYQEGVQVALSDGYTNTDAIVTSVVDTVHASPLRAISGLNGDEMIMYSVRYYNSSGAEALLWVGLEVAYTAYS